PCRRSSPRLVELPGSSESGRDYVNRFSPWIEAIRLEKAKSENRVESTPHNRGLTIMRTLTRLGARAGRQRDRPRVEQRVRPQRRGEPEQILGRRAYPTGGVDPAGPVVGVAPPGAGPGLAVRALVRIADRQGESMKSKKGRKAD